MMNRTGDSSVASNVQPVRTRTLSEALSFILEVRETFRDQSNRYSTFLKIVHEWKEQKRENRVDFPAVVARVKEVFNGHKNLIIGLNGFLLPADKIPLDDEDDNEEEGSVMSTARHY
ncbi:PREDICTED: paired amphipathic helix protein Sin3-like 1 [Camelina sativa]|uniref:Paired amphipathic helix protein Sin3-like 1 n=1 Tax=Camelina sativa TaxID=90675 RepID=A0ABM0T306_CAMSA|nr:PREDICTED: paired amphipathic helix protein Sin3-like 1 [Camelina sativa]